MTRTVGLTRIGEAMDGSGTWDVRAALRTADWKAIGPRLVSYTRWRYVVATGRVPTANAVEEVIDEAVLRVLDGRRQWHRDDAPDLVAFLCGVIHSLVHEFVTKKGRDARRVDGRDPEELMSPQARPDTRTSYADTRLEFIEEAIGDDGELGELYLGILESSGKREDVAQCLGWEVDRVSVLTKKLKRRLLALAKTKTATTSKQEQR